MKCIAVAEVKSLTLVLCPSPSAFLAQPLKWQIILLFSVLRLAIDLFWSVESGKELKLCKIQSPQGLKRPLHISYSFFSFFFYIVMWKTGSNSLQIQEGWDTRNIAILSSCLLPYRKAARIKPGQCEVGSLATSSLNQLNVRDSPQGRANTCRLSWTTESLGWCIDECGWLHVAANLSSDSIASLTSTLVPSSLLSVF